MGSKCVGPAGTNAARVRASRTDGSSLFLSARLDVYLSKTLSVCLSVWRDAVSVCNALSFSFLFLYRKRLCLKSTRAAFVFLSPHNATLWNGTVRFTNSSFFSVLYSGLFLLLLYLIFLLVSQTIFRRKTDRPRPVYNLRNGVSLWLVAHVSLFIFFKKMIMWIFFFFWLY